jgi:hypothetical protein
MALKRDLKAIFILDLYDILLQIATQQQQGSWNVGIVRMNKV